MLLQAARNHCCLSARNSAAVVSCFRDEAVLLDVAAVCKSPAREY